MNVSVPATASGGSTKTLATVILSRRADRFNAITEEFESNWREALVGVKCNQNLDSSRVDDCSLLRISPLLGVRPSIAHMFQQVCASPLNTTYGGFLFFASLQTYYRI